MANITYLEEPLETEALYEKLCPPVRNWFKNKFPDFTVPFILFNFKFFFVKFAAYFERSEK